MERLELSLAQSYEIEKMGRLIDGLSSIDELRAICKELAKAWMTQKAACTWLMRQNLSSPPTIRSID